MAALTESQQATFNDMTQNYGMSAAQALSAMGQAGYTTVAEATSGSSSGSSSTPTSSSAASTSTSSSASTPTLSQEEAQALVEQQYATIGRTGVGNTVNTIDQEGLDFWTNALTSGTLDANSFQDSFNAAVDSYMAANPNDEYTNYVNTYRTTSTASNDATSQAIVNWLTQNPNATDAQISAQMDAAGVTPAQVAAATGVSEAEVQARYNAATTGSTTGAPNATAAALQGVVGSDNVAVDMSNPYAQTVLDAYESLLGRTAEGGTAQIDGAGVNWWADQLQSGAVTAEDFNENLVGAALYNINQSGSATSQNQALRDKINASAAAAGLTYDPATNTITGLDTTTTAAAETTDPELIATLQALQDQIAALQNKSTFTPGTGVAVTAGGLPDASQAGAYSDTVAGQTVQQALTQPSTVIPEAAKQTYTQQDVQTNELMTAREMAAPTPITAGQITPEELSPVPNMTATEVQQIQDIAAASYEAAMTGNVPDLTAATTGAPSQLVTAAQGEITALAEAAQGTMPVSALMSNQVEQLLQTANGEDYPSWALPAVRAAENALAARGLGRSSIAKEALMSSIINATLPIAQSNAAALQQDYLANLNNRQQAAITNANNLAQMDLANLNANQQAQVENAKAFLSIDLANLTNQQQANVVNAQIRQQNMLSDQAATNAAAQFNAANQQQADQFMANLNTSIAQNNAAREDAASQYNSQLAQQRAALDVANQLEADRLTAQLQQTADQFNAQLEFNRDQFNIQNATAIEQSNVQWRRQVNTANTAGVNAVNQANAMNAFNLSNQALTLLWQENRDAANWAFQSAQNAADQQTRMAIAALGNEAIKEQGDVDLITSLAKSAVTLYLGK